MTLKIMTRGLKRLTRMDAAEAAWRGRALLYRAADAIGATIREPRWDRRRLAAVLAGGSPHASEPLARARKADWMCAHRAIAAQIVAGPQRFLIAPASRSTLRMRIARDYPSAARHAAERADRIVEGRHDLLGYRDLQYGAGALPDWHLDPVSGRRAPLKFWAAVPFLEPECGDHKVIWEINRHQHWLMLGRAWWLTGDPRYRAAFIAQLEDWLATNPPLMGINWASMLELAFRTLSWIWCLNLFADGADEDTIPWTVDLLIAIDRQLTHIERNLSYYFSPNTHLTGEALALYISGHALPQLAASRQRIALGRRILLTEIAAQIGEDGGHRERSAHYHRYTLDYYLAAAVVAGINADPAADPFTGAAAKLGFAARVLADERGRLPRLGDDDGGSLVPICGRAADDIRDSLAVTAALVGRADLRVGTVPEEARWWLSQPLLDVRLDRVAGVRVPPDAIPSTALPETGYYVSRSGRDDHLVIDGGVHGFQNGGHAHADALSLVLTLRGRPLLIDPGTGCYTVNRDIRDRFRSTRLHNTVVVDGTDSGEPDGPFHWARTADARVRRWRTNGAFDYFEGAHDGFNSLEHRRHVFVTHGDLLVVADLLTGTGEHEMRAHWHVDRRWRAELRGRSATLANGPERVGLIVPAGDLSRFTADAESGLGWHAPAYGRIEAATTICVSRTGAAPLWVITVFALNGDDPVSAVEAVPVWAEGGTLAHSTAIRLERRATIDYLLLADPVGNVRSTWRVGEFETDARLLFCRVRADGAVARVAMADGSLVRSSHRGRLQFSLPRAASDVSIDLTGVRADEGIEAVEARVSGSAFGARLVARGHELALAVDRRAAPRPYAGRQS